MESEGSWLVLQLHDELIYEVGYFYGRAFLKFIHNGYPINRLLYTSYAKGT